jgi:coenzyme F420-0:L-glutamate ligase/coenzyme F420-1:gamma-L-glutamate ligase
MFALGAREAVVAAVRGRDADCFGSPAEPEEVRLALESCGLDAVVTGESVRVHLPRTGPDSGVRDQVVAVERVRLIAHAHGWLPHSDTATRHGADADQDHVMVSPASP